ncbi:DUF202 domain-containing protein [Romeria aff. gracilis LEGE 07310]|uniref:DUF202 domain-containing protein n=1 Tax=Vasconcelosia minhoensis LEGE 07310 TaxID=915328 RepID=A0A8J7DPL9_9CYAN|nr:DUF202 domain-containing protein [Romeria gracilis]MBE9079910.1 DUF202 domain-containing protein [Romeria aff. gracilis LEGE 07310]
MSHSRKPDRQREHQANERTFLAWLRTSISLIGFGFAIARFGIFLQQLEAVTASSEPPASNSQLLGIGLVIFGIVVIILAAWRYNRAFLQIERGYYRPSRWAIWLLSGIATLLGLLSIPLLMRQPSPTKPTPSSSPSQLRRY